jgi:hypothetical protein
MTWAELKRQAEALGVTNDTEVVLLKGWQYERIISLDDEARLVITPRPDSRANDSEGLTGLHRAATVQPSREAHPSRDLAARPVQSLYGFIVLASATPAS